MKKIPLIFPAILMACSSPKQIVAPIDHQKYIQPYTITAVGVWLPGYLVLTLVDAKHNYFTVKTANDPAYVRGAVYKPSN